MTPGIHAGVQSQINWADGNWVFLDIGFANRMKCCGLLFGDEDPVCVRFTDATRKIMERLTESRGTMNLVVEAPLSVCFDSEGNPKYRTIEKEGTKRRYWYTQSGCVVMVAAMYLIRGIYEAKAAVPVRLFEGFVSYKDSSRRSDHKEDVRLLRNVVHDPIKFSQSIFAADRLISAPTDSLAGC